VAVKILFIHQEFPGQFKHLAPALVRQGHEVTALRLANKGPFDWQGVRVVPYQPAQGSTPGVHPWVRDFESKAIRGQACFLAAQQLKSRGYAPDLVIAHPGWGESLFIKDVWPQTRLGIYCEFFYQNEGLDVGFDLEFAEIDASDVCRLRLKNLNNLLHFDIADAGISPTLFQAETFRHPFRQRISVIHDGIDTQAIGPNASVSVNIQTASGLEIALTRSDEVVTFVNRNLEPHRGYHIFMRALPNLLKSRPHTRVLMVGGTGVSYGAIPDPVKYGKRSWHQIFVDEVRPQISDADWARVHFLGNIPYPQFLALLQLSRVHVYLTYPFVLSWSLIEAMSSGCAIVASNTAPVREVIADDITGRLVDFFDVDGLTKEIADLLQDTQRAERYGQAARAHACANYDLQKVCLPAQLRWVESLAA
jgi:glycosyltransferase involved in cell wall biosynthesis